MCRSSRSKLNVLRNAAFVVGIFLTTNAIFFHAEAVLPVPVVSCPRPVSLADLPLQNLLGSAEELRPFIRVGIFGEDGRQVVSQHVYPYSAIGRLLYTVDFFDEQGRLQGSAESWCTATLISNCHIATARHCVQPGIRTPGRADPCFRPGAQERRNFRFADSTGRIHALGAMHTGGPTEPRDDYAFFRTNRNIGSGLGTVAVREFRGDSITRRQVLAPGYSADRFDGQLLTEDIRGDAFYSADPLLIRFRAASSGGASGGPLLMNNERGVPELVGIIIQAQSDYNHQTCRVTNRQLPENEEERLEMAVSSAAFLESLRGFQRANPCRAL